MLAQSSKRGRTMLAKIIRRFVGIALGLLCTSLPAGLGALMEA